MLAVISTIRMEVETVLLAIMLGVLQTPKHSIQNSINYGAEFLTFNHSFHEIIPNSGFACPEQYFIWKIDIRFQNAENVTRSFKWDLTASYAADETVRTWVRKPGPCDTIRHCLGYQACLFKFGNEFCRKDPIPLVRKIMLLKVTCALDEFYSSFPPATEFPHPKRRNYYVLHMDTRSLDDDDLFHGNYAKSVIRFSTIHEAEIFLLECPPVDEVHKYGFHGNCSQNPPDSKTVAADLWRVLGRVVSPQCRKELLDVYCSYKYNRQGDCIPPMFIDKKSSSLPPFSFSSLPKNGFRPDLSNYIKIHHAPHRALIPARIGFYILVHSDPKALFQLFDQIYRSDHFYVIHVDKRASDMRKSVQYFIKDVYHNPKNIRVLPMERSFSSSWGSFQVLRAELECYEELLRMGIWDFVVNLSGSDLALRDVDDLAAALAPHRGANFLRLNKPFHFDSDRASQHSWYSCGAHVYNVTTREAKLPVLQGSSQFKIISREFANYIVSDDRGDVINNITYYLQTSLIPDESYIPTVLYHSPFRSTQLFSTTTHLKAFERENINHLCRHSDDIDLCGQGPATFNQHDFADLQYETNHVYFARKFSSNYEDRTRTELLRWARDGYYNEVSAILPRNMIGQMGELVIQKLQEQGHRFLIQGIEYRMFKKLVPSDPCCRVPHERSVKQGDEFGYWLEMKVVKPADTSTEYYIRASLDMSSSFKCYPGGHLRMVHVNTRPDIRPRQAKGVHPLEYNFPVPVLPAGGQIMWITLLLHLSHPSKECTDKENTVNPQRRKYFEFPRDSLKRKLVATVGGRVEPHIVGAVDQTKSPSANTIDVFIDVVDPDGDIHCSNYAIFDLSRVRILEEENTTLHTTALNCDTFHEGLWTIRIRDLNEDHPFHYTIPVYLYNEDNQAVIPNHIVKKLWTVTDVMFLPESDYYGNVEKPEKKPVNQHSGKPTKKNKTERKSAGNLGAGMKDWG